MTDASDPPHHLMPDAFTSRPVLTGDDAAAVFGRLFDEYAPGLQRYVTRRIGAAGAEDVVAESFLTAFRRRAAYDPARAEIRAWLYGIATNLLRKYLDGETRQLRATARLNAAQRTSADGHEDAAIARLDAEVRVSQLAAAIATLNAGDRDVLLLTAWAGMDSAEIAAALDIPVGTVRSRLHRVRGQLRLAAARAHAIDIAKE
ncbi:MAG TPA: RNA polymerase sigma factor, partial [Candidatus Acidoferrum sp.]|jgi:RNA polymerase sigma factor (sigma-70 family)|nr:RNA polymerase sigma factor [Candidatus Acidoferrum sp.]